jgi:hypothetical protein
MPPIEFIILYLWTIKERETPQHHILTSLNFSAPHFSLLLCPALRDGAKCMTGTKRSAEPHRKTYKTAKPFVLPRGHFGKRDKK